MTFLAIDFETANRYPDSACSVGLVRVTGGSITEKRTLLIRPPYDLFEFSHIHGITLRDVRRAPTFRERWKSIAPFFEGIDFAVAHNAPFDRRVLEACCRTFAITPPEVEFRCTVRLSRSVLRIKPANLSNVCRELFIPLEHHEAGSDAEACARIMMEVLRREEERQR
ncbi:MAG: 3'-5' exonuclease [Bacteroidetes bacterium]|nr:MAG: 3'-5' exonuclease [Bacteroidota bacterium]